jgi:GNAT superfamily N-acetyltransferase
VRVQSSLVEDVRGVAPDEWRLWRDVRLRALADAPDAFGSSLAEWERADERRWRRRLNDVPFNVVAVTGDVPVGQASGTAASEDRRVELISLWVVAESRGTGVARALVDAVTEWARGVGPWKCACLSAGQTGVPSVFTGERASSRSTSPETNRTNSRWCGHCTLESAATPGDLPPAGERPLVYCFDLHGKTSRFVSHKDESDVSAHSRSPVEMVHGALDVLRERLNGVDHEMVVCPVLPLVPPGEDLVP